MNRPTLAFPTRKLLAGLLVFSLALLAIGWTAGRAAASGSNPTPSPTTSAEKGNSTLVGPLAPGDPQSGLSSGGGTASAASGVASGSSGTAIAYPMPVYPGSLGAAPEGTILAGGSGTADMKTDGSDRASALSKATTAAMADAREQAQAVATSMGVALKGVYSVTISTADNYAYPVPECLAPAAAPGALDGAAAPNEAASDAPAIEPVPSVAVCTDTKATTPDSAQLVVTLIVAYSFA